MASKKELIKTILQELRKAQTTEWNPPADGPVNRISLPPSLPIGNGKQLRATDVLLEAVLSYSKLWLENDPLLRPRFKVEEFNKLARQAFGKVLQTVDLDERNDALVESIIKAIDPLLIESIAQHHRAIDLTLGCHLLKGGDAYPTRVGPVLFESRPLWLQRSLALERLSPITVRRLESRWAAKSMGKRKPSIDEHTERAALDAIGDCPIICTVETSGLSGKYVQEKGLLAARLAMLAVALMWAHPSEGLRWMHLLYDRRAFHRHTLLFSEKRFAGSNSDISQMPEGRWTNAELIADLRAYQWLFDQVGEALFNYVQPTRDIARPQVMNALFLSLWWFHEACREPLDQIATTKFAASMDALVKGQSANHIIQFIEARLGSRLVQSQKATAAARLTAERKFLASLS